MFLERSASRWWILVVRGLLAILFSVIVVTVPGAAVLAMVLIFGFYAIFEGLTLLSLTMLRRGPTEGGLLLGLEGVLGIIAGTLALTWPGITAVWLFYLIGVWSIALGVLELAALASAGEVENERALTLSGLLFMGAGVTLLVWPRLGVVSAIALIAGTVMARGVTLLVAGYRLRTIDKRLKTGHDVTT